MKLNFRALTLIAVLGLVVFWELSAERPLGPSAIPQHTADIENGKFIYNVGGCISCHASPTDAEVPSGGKPLKTPIGVLYPPNLTPDPETGLGNWSDLDFVNAMQRGLGRGVGHLIPAFPYTSYAKMKVEDVLDVKAYLASLPPIKNAIPQHEVFALPLVRRGLGLWKWVGLNTSPWVADPAQSDSWNRGAYLVNGPGHCQECHTPRNLFMAMDSSKAFDGGPHPEGKGKVPSMRGLVERGRYKDVADLVSAFQNGEVLGYEHMSSGGMGEVQSNLSKLPDAELKAMAEYVLSLK
ncbi:MAG: cytochrome c [Aestuariivirga sp.]